MKIAGEIRTEKKPRGPRRNLTITDRAAALRAKSARARAKAEKWDEEAAGLVLGAIDEAKRALAEAEQAR